MPPVRNFLTPLTGNIPRRVIPAPVEEAVTGLALKRLTGRTKPRPIRIGKQVYRSINEACVLLRMKRPRIATMLRNGKAELCKPGN
jgi:hypothetical protein